MVTVVQGKVCAKNHPDRLSRLATIHQRYRRTDGRTDGRISYGISQSGYRKCSKTHYCNILKRVLKYNFASLEIHRYGILAAGFAAHVACGGIKVFNDEWKLSVLHVRLGSAFQIIDPATETARQPNTLRQWRGTNSWWRLAERSCRLWASSETGQQDTVGTLMLQTVHCRS